MKRIYFLLPIFIIALAHSWLPEAFAQVSLEQGRIAYWRLDEGSGNDIFDSSGNGYHGVIASSPANPAWKDNAGASALEFDGIDDFASVNANLTMGTNSFSVSMWVLIKQFTVNYAGLVYYGNVFNNGYGFSMYESAGEAKYLRFCSGEVNPANAVPQWAGCPLAAYQWYHLVGIRENKGTTEDLSLYINGALFLAREGLPLANVTSAGPLYFGRTANGQYLNAIIDEVMIYNRALTSEEVLALKNSFTPMDVPPPPPANEPPAVNAGYDQVVEWGNADTITLTGIVTDDGLPSPPGSTTVIWSLKEGPAPVTFANINALVTNATFTQKGTYIIQLAAQDGEYQDSDEMVVTVADPVQYSSGIVYYVDAVIGNDNNPGTGTTAYQAWETVNKVNTAALNPGDVVLFRRGQAWDGSSVTSSDYVLSAKSGTEGNPIIYAAYGSGPDPIFDGAQKLSACRISNRSYVTLDHLHLINNNSTFRGVLNVDSNSHHITIRNCEIHEASTYEVIYWINSNDGLIENCRIYGNRGNDDYGSVVYLYNASRNIIRDCEIYDTASAGGDCLSITGNSDDNLIEGNEIYGPAENGIYLRAADANCRDPQFDPELLVWTSNNVLRHNFIHNINGIGIQLRDGAANNQVYYNILINNDGPVIQSDGLYGDGDFVGNPAPYGRARDNKIYNNFIFNTAGAHGIHVFAKPGENQGVEVKNNIIIAENGHCLMLDANSQASGAVSDHNCFYVYGTGDYAVWNGFTYKTFEQYKTAAAPAVPSQDQNSLAANPSIASLPPATPNDAKLNTGSLCMNAGADVGLAKDFYGTAVAQGTAPEIGAFEFSETALVKYGDIDGSSGIDSFDAALTAQAAVGTRAFTPEQFQAADVDGSEDISAYDAALIARKAVGLIGKFPVEG